MKQAAHPTQLDDASWVPAKWLIAVMLFAAALVIGFHEKRITTIEVDRTASKNANVEFQKDVIDRMARMETKYDEQSKILTKIETKLDTIKR